MATETYEGLKALEMAVGKFTFGFRAPTAILFISKFHSFFMTLS